MRISQLWIKNENRDVGDNRQGVAVSKPRELCLSWEENTRFSGKEIVFHKLELDLTPRMLQNSIEKELEAMSKHPSSSSKGQSDLGTSVVPSQD